MDKLERDTSAAAGDDRGAASRATGKQLCKQLLRNQDARDAFVTLTVALGELLRSEDYRGLDQNACEQAMMELEALKDALLASAAAADCVH